MSLTPKQKPTKTPGKTFSALEIAYKNLTFQGKVEGRDIASFGGSKPAYDVLTKAQPGDVYDIDVFKNDAGFNDWIAAKKSDGSATTNSNPTTAPAGGAYAASKAPSTGGSTYATAEERAKTQVYIVRQSNITAAINLHTVGAKTPPSIDAILATARRFEDHVFGTSNDPVDTAKPAVARSVETSFDDLDDLPE